MSEEKVDSQMEDKTDRNGKILGLLALNAILLQKMAACLANNNEQGVGKPVLTFIEQAVALHGDGYALQQDIYALGKDLGIEFGIVDIGKEAHA